MNVNLPATTPTETSQSQGVTVDSTLSGSTDARLQVVASSSYIPSQSTVGSPSTSLEQRDVVALPEGGVETLLGQDLLNEMQDLFPESEELSIDINDSYRDLDMNPDQGYKETATLKSSPSGLTRHLTHAHSDVRPYSCTETDKDGNPCTSAFTTGSNLRRHLAFVHSDARPFRCTGKTGKDGQPCSSEFKTKEKLKQHLSHVHGDVRPYSCTGYTDKDGQPCTRTFTTNSNLKRHLVHAHGDERSFRCTARGKDGQLCTSTFKSEANLKKHINQAHSDERPFQCTARDKNEQPCTWAFKTNSDLKRHILRVHGGTQSLKRASGDLSSASHQKQKKKQRKVAIGTPSTSSETR